MFSPPPLLSKPLPEAEIGVPGELPTRSAADHIDGPEDENREKSGEGRWRGSFQKLRDARKLGGVERIPAIPLIPATPEPDTATETTPAELIEEPRAFVPSDGRAEIRPVGATEDANEKHRLQRVLRAFGIQSRAADESAGPGDDVTGALSNANSGRPRSRYSELTEGSDENMESSDAEAMDASPSATAASASLPTLQYPPTIVAQFASAPQPIVTVRSQAPRMPDEPSLTATVPQPEMAPEEKPVIILSLSDSKGTTRFDLPPKVTGQSQNAALLSVRQPKQTSEAPRLDEPVQEESADTTVAADRSYRPMPQSTQEPPLKGLPRPQVISIAKLQSQAVDSQPASDQLNSDNNSPVPAPSKYVDASASPTWIAKPEQATSTAEEADLQFVIGDDAPPQSSVAFRLDDGPGFASIGDHQAAAPKSSGAGAPTLARKDSLPPTSRLASARADLMGQHRAPPEIVSVHATTSSAGASVKNEPSFPAPTLARQNSRGPSDANDDSAELPSIAPMPTPSLVRTLPAPSSPEKNAAPEALAAQETSRAPEKTAKELERTEITLEIASNSSKATSHAPSEKRETSEVKMAAPQPTLATLDGPTVPAEDMAGRGPTPATMQPRALASINPLAKKTPSELDEQQPIADEALTLDSFRNTLIPAPSIDSTPLVLRSRVQHGIRRDQPPFAFIEPRPAKTDSQAPSLQEPIAWVPPPSSSAPENAPHPARNELLVLEPKPTPAPLPVERTVPGMINTVPEHDVAHNAASERSHPIAVETLPAKPSENRKRSASVSSVATSGRIDLKPRQTSMLRIDGQIDRTVVGDTDVCEIVQFAPDQAVVIAKAPGATEVRVWMRNGEPAKTYQIKVNDAEHSLSASDQDFQKLCNTIRDLYPGARVRLIPSGERLVARGTVNSREEAIQILSLVRKVRLSPVVDELVIDRTADRDDRAVRR